jgi:hypothetical protein
VATSEDLTQRLPEQGGFAENLVHALKRKLQEWTDIRVRPFEDDDAVKRRYSAKMKLKLLREMEFLQSPKAIDRLRSDRQELLSQIMRLEDKLARHELEVECVSHQISEDLQALLQSEQHMTKVLPAMLAIRNRKSHIAEKLGFLGELKILEDWIRRDFTPTEGADLFHFFESRRNRIRAPKVHIENRLCEDGLTYESVIREMIKRLGGTISRDVCPLAHLLVWASALTHARPLRKTCISLKFKK